MVGDSAVDVETARNAEVKCCGVTYGLQPESFERQPPDFLIERMEELLAVVQNGNRAAFSSQGALRTSQIDV
jgi:phosphoglycolate phosphatase